VDVVSEHLQQAKERYRLAEEGARESLELAADDLRFASGDQWPAEVKRQREAEGRPCLTINLLPKYIRQITGDARQNKPAIKVRPTKDATEDTAKVFEGLIRNIEDQSRASNIYVTALSQTATCSMGHWQVCTDYADDSSFEQDIFIKRIDSPMSVIWDANAKELDRSDAMYCFVVERITKEAFEAKYPDKAPQNWDDPVYRESAGGWFEQDKIRVAAYWEKRPIKKYIAQIDDGQVIDVTDFKDNINELQGNERIVNIKTVDSFEIYRSLLDGVSELEKPKKWAGSIIPIVSVFGPEEFLENRSRFVSLIRYTKDSQRMYNYWTTQITEKIALAPKVPYVGTSKMFSSHKKLWEKANTANLAFLPYTPDPDAPGMRPQREQPAPLNVAEIEQRNQAADDIKNTTGLYDAAVGNRSNETSGRAILARAREGDTATYEWIDNLAVAIEHTGYILLDLIPKIYDTPRIVRILGEDSSVKEVPINQVFQSESGEILAHDMTTGKYDLTITVGPSFATQKMEAAASMIDFVRAVPGAAEVSSDLLARNMDWPGADEIADRLKRTIPPEIIGDNESPEAQEAQQAAMAEQQEALDLQKRDAEAEIESKEAKTYKDVQDGQAQEIENEITLNML